ncbi:hypothetical protein GCM10023153_31440 [Ornithinibacter aureus]|uniref:DUF3696 domain-containing protein n=2 Tax=Ornithinibacter aureus TaxID=622664 RepID=A0ABP8K9M8_9MICO|nr:AAA family ATPase [Ornithinibacter aureus]KAF0833907.1 uncharacterized protein DUF3696 [Ornithinibacter aureus]
MSESEWHEGLSLRSWRLRNFKSVANAEVHLAPLTVVVGANSAGKSTLLQSIRVAAQAANSSGDAFPLNGEQIRLGTFEETRFSAAAPDEPIEIGGCFHLGSPEFYASTDSYLPFAASARRRARRRLELADDTRLEWDVTLKGSPKGQSAASNIVGVKVRALVEGMEHASLSATQAKRKRPTHSFGHQVQYEGAVREYDEQVASFIDANILGGFPMSYLFTLPLADMLFQIWFDVRSEAVRANLPKRGTGPHDPRGRELRTATNRERTDPQAAAQRITGALQSIIDEAPDTMLESIHAERLIRAHIRELERSNPTLAQGDWTSSQLVHVYDMVTTALRVGDRSAPRIETPPEILRDAIADARDFLSTRVQHLGPLRMDPAVVYRSSPAVHPGFIGDKGEYTASVLDTNGRQPVHSFPPIPGRSIRPHSLSEAVNAWAAHLGIADAFTTEDRGRLGLQLSVRQPDVDAELDLTSVGTGVSQLLPVLVMCLQAPPGSLLLIEQPELHLNPGVQQRLADFLLAVAGSGRQLIVETHSDYLVTRLRRRTAEDRTGRVQRRVGLVFAERHKGATRYIAVQPELDGSMSNWPEGFFDESAEDSAALLESLLGHLKP